MPFLRKSQAQKGLTSTVAWLAFCCCIRMALVPVQGLGDFFYFFFLLSLLRFLFSLSWNGSCIHSFVPLFCQSFQKWGSVLCKFHTKMVRVGARQIGIKGWPDTVHGLVKMWHMLGVAQSHFSKSGSH